MARLFDVCIRGDGVVGRTLALLLAQERLRVALVGSGPPGEAVLPESTDVRAYALNAASRRTLEDLRAWPIGDAATPVRAMQVWGDDGGRVDFDASSLPRTTADQALAWIVDVPALTERLVEATRYQPQIEIIAEPAAAALSVVCEGRASLAREGLDVQWDVTPYFQHAIAARVRADQPHAGVARQWFTGGDVLALLPMGGTAGHDLALVWSVSQARADALKQLDAVAFCNELQAVCGAHTGALQLISERASWPLALSQATCWVGPGWALTGDAAHTVHPLAGQGLNLGLADAACLAKVLAAREYWRPLGDEKLLRRYERARKGDVAAMGAMTDGLHTLFAQNGSGWQSLRNWGMNSFAQSRMLKSWATQRATGL